MGYVLGVLDNMSKAPLALHSALPSFEVPLHEMMAYNSPLYYNHVQGLLANEHDRSAAILGELLGVDSRTTHMANGTYHGVLPIDSLQLRINNSVTARTGGVNTVVINTNGHHFALLWVVAAPAQGPPAVPGLGI